MSWVLIARTWTDPYSEPIFQAHGPHQSISVLEYADLETYIRMFDSRFELGITYAYVDIFKVWLPTPNEEHVPHTPVQLVYRRSLPVKSRLTLNEKGAKV